MPDTSDIIWHWRHFDVFTVREWHEVLKLRSRVFVVEQNCPYIDPDHKDPLSWHLSGYCGDQLLATLRVVQPGVSYREPSIGRVVNHPEWRGLHIGDAMMRRGIAFCQAQWQAAIRISAQAYLEGFYEAHGFKTVRGPYDEDGIPHLEMVRAP